MNNNDNIYDKNIVTIIDCYVHNEHVKLKLVTILEKLKESGHNILLISNTTVDNTVMQYCDHFIYSNKNILFENEYLYDKIKLYRHYGTFELHDVIESKQKHGLSVLVNLFNALHHAKRLGYTHFNKIEHDAEFGPLSLESIHKIPKTCKEEGKKGFFFINTDKNPVDMSVHYFHCEIDHFINNVYNISSEDDYSSYLIQNGISKFLPVEEFLYNNIKSMSDIKAMDGKFSASKFPDTMWNTYSTPTNFDPKYKKCVTELYRFYSRKNNIITDEESFIVLTYNYDVNRVDRYIEIHYDSGLVEMYNHVVEGLFCWQYHKLPKENVTKFIVKEKDEIIYESIINKVNSVIIIDE